MTTEWADKLGTRFVAEPTGCWLWDGGIDGNGYGAIRIGTHRRVSAHRLSYVLERGQIPDKLEVCHSCDVPRCIRPEHLFIGTRRDNCMDAARKGRLGIARGEHSGARLHPERIARGERHGGAILTETEVISMRAMREGGATYRVIGSRFGVTTSAAYDVCSGRRWKHVKGNTTCLHLG